MCKYIITAICLISALGCAGGGPSNSPTSSIASYTLIGSSDGFTSSSSTEISGTGQVLFGTPTDEVSTGHDFEFEVSVDDGGSIQFHFFSDTSFSGGANITLTRSGSSFDCTFEINSKSMSCTTHVSALDATGSLPFNVDVHNDENPTHALFWSGTSFAENDALFNTETDFAGLVSGDKATGTAWGLTLTNATITKASIGEPLFEEE